MLLFYLGTPRPVDFAGHELPELMTYCEMKTFLSFFQSHCRPKIAYNSSKSCFLRHYFTCYQTKYFVPERLKIHFIFFYEL